MVIRPPKDAHIIALIGSVGIIAVMALCELEYNDPNFLMLVPLVMILRRWVTIGRTFVFDKEGCTVRFICIQRFYPWSEMKIKKVEYFGDRYDHRSVFVSGAVFCNKQVRRARWMRPETYGTIFHPFNFIFVYFDPKIPPVKGAFKPEGLYVVDEVEFRKK